MTAKHVTLANGLNVAYTEEGQGTPVLLLHGYCGSSAYWEEVWPLLVPHARLVAPDARGHGGTSATEGAYAMEQQAEDAVQLMDALGLRQAYVLGHSMGGYAALALAERYPERLLGFGLLHSTSYPDNETGKENREKVARRVAEEGVEGHVADLIPKLFAPAHLNTMPEKVERAKRIGYETSPLGAIGGALGMKDRPDRKVVLEKTALPVLLLAGESDGVIAPEKRFPVDRPNVTGTLLSGSGHMGMLEAPEAFAEAVLAYLQAAEENRADA
ncbi:alpha/beta fold hydrolase [Cohnella nanjingensis]|uniref:Alpha/beta hydrolase n=1 Tax=Cohnella nanjingensis TaxID=1387779 RepID=A0A7X0RSA3_9BACL|nr:alpha/beta hydrolase [Cohnella nanjingensis]MBB6672568.1 alpha/beta hydrolase [Cohnella nanjingensis]